MSSGYPPYGGTQRNACQRCQAPLFPNEATCRNCGYYNVLPAQAPGVSDSSWGNLTPQQPQSQSGPPSWGQFPVSPASPPPMPSPQTQNTPNNPPATSLRNFLGPSSLPSSPMQSNGSFSNPTVPPAYTGTPPSFAPQRPSGTLSTGPQTFGTPPTGPVSQAPYGTPATGFQQFGAPPVPGQQLPGTGPSAVSPTQSTSLQPFPMATAAAPSSPELSRFTQSAFNETPLVSHSKPWMIPLIIILVIVLAGGGFVGYTLLNTHSAVPVTPTSVATGGVPKGTPFFTDTFKNNANGWSLQTDPPHFSIALADNALVLEDDNNDLLWEPLPGNKSFGDFTLSVDAMLSRGDQINGYGIYVRGSSVQNAELATYYRFELYGDGSYAIFKGTVDTNGKPTSAKLVDYTLNPAIHKQGILNHMTITAKGSTLSLMVNGQLVKTITDTSYANGTIAPFVSNMQNAKAGAQAKFENLMIYPA